ncbi:MAG TPA: UPF0280 family protein [Alphaproteobacteria bacterium]|nr:UPF0280 family protein [Alphaproteobacteria bacterium]
MTRAQVTLLPDKQRLHLQDGPIDLVIEAFGRPQSMRAAYAAAAARFAAILDELCAELPLLRARAVPEGHTLKGPIARRMWAAVAPFARESFITPMAAVAGAVAEEVLSTMVAAAPLSRAYVNNGGDIALHLAPGTRIAVGMVNRPDQPALLGTATLHAEQPVRGIATSGWRGRSFSLGIADAVTVLADTAAQADAAATVIANAVNLPAHPGIRRARASELQPDSDLGRLLVTREVPRLAPSDVQIALAAGLACAERARERGLIIAAALHLQSRTLLLGAAEPRALQSTKAEWRCAHA